MSIFERTKKAAEAFDRRPVDEVYSHLLTEMVELRDEVTHIINDHEPGPDGIKGEIIDCIACLVDMYQQHDPDATEEEFLDIYQKKLDKWRAKY